MAALTELNEEERHASISEVALLCSLGVPVHGITHKAEVHWSTLGDAFDVLFLEVVRQDDREDSWGELK